MKQNPLFISDESELVLKTSLFLMVKFILLFNEDFIVIMLIPGSKERINKLIL